jgi:predicted anti-sigma-YlaC factor YlaD
MICAELEDRLFDEDCRAALLGRGAVPVDVAEHAARCPACAQQWAEAAADTRQLSERLVVAPPPALLGDLYRAFRPRSRAWALRVDTETLSWVIAGGALGASLTGGVSVPTGLPEWAGFCVGASVGLTLVAVGGGPRTWLAPWAALRSAAAHCIDRLARAI